MIDERAVMRARIASAFDALLSAAMARLRLHYATRISALLLVKRGDPSAALATLMSEREAALAGLCREIMEDRRRALRAVRRRRRRYRVNIGRLRAERPRRPERTGGLRRTVRRRAGTHNHSP